MAKDDTGLGKVQTATQDDDADDPHELTVVGVEYIGENGQRVEHLLPIENWE